MAADTVLPTPAASMSGRFVVVQAAVPIQLLVVVRLDHAIVLTWWAEKCRFVELIPRSKSIQIESRRVLIRCACVLSEVH